MKDLVRGVSERPCGEGVSERPCGEGSVKDLVERGQ